MSTVKPSNKRFESKYGYFSEDGLEYIITRPDTPRPWVNIISNGDYGLVVSQAGGGFSWRTHVQFNRLTRWTQDLVRDDWGKWLYLRDLDNGELRSLAFQPVQAKFDSYRVRHGLGYTVFEQAFDEINTEWTLFPAKDDPVEIWICTLANKGKQTKRLQLASYFEWNLGLGPDNNREFHKIFIDTNFDSELRAIYAQKYLWEVPSERGHWNTNWPYLAFHAVNTEVRGWDASKDALLGRHGGFHNPQGIKSGAFTGTSGRFEDAVSSLATNVFLQPGEEKTVVFLLGQIDRTEGAEPSNQIKPFIQKYASVQAAAKELDRVKKFWTELIGRTEIETPDPAFDLLTNVWLKYQAISGHLWARTGYYQQSGAFGFRDQLQTSQIWLPIEPKKMLEQIKLHAGHQFQKGVVLHWWHPLTDQGLATDMTDDLLWLPFMLERYCREVGNYSALQETVPFYDDGQATLQEHCLKAIEVVLNRFSPRGLPLIGAGDWCDGFSAVGLDWKGESIWLGMFLYHILTSWALILEKFSPQADKKVAQDYRLRAALLREALNKHGWNGEWYIAATKDDGAPIGDKANDEGKIYLNSQIWAVLSDVADDERKKLAIKAMLERLESDNGLLLLAPAFSVPDTFIGYITRYAPGLRENGGVYTHAATWGVMALAMMGMADEAQRIVNKLNPILQTEKDADRYSAEPYVLPGNIDGPDSKYYGRAGWSWYTGSAGWLFTIALEYIIGVRAVYEGLLIDPCIPAEWGEVKMKRLFRGGVYNITIENPDRVCGGVKEISVNGMKLSGAVIPHQGAGEHKVTVILCGRKQDTP